MSWRKRYNLVNGSTQGLSHNLMQLAYFRPPNRHAQYRNLSFAGASTRPGGVAHGYGFPAPGGRARYG
ncbi:MAG: hypothetical protein WEA61_08005 [Anaerolineales bacterium]